MNLNNIVLVNLTKDRASLEFTQKSLNYLYNTYSPDIDDSNIPVVETIFSSGTFSGGEYDPKFRISVKNKDVYLFGISSIESRSAIAPDALIFRALAASKAAYDNGAENVNVVFPDLFFSRADKLYSDFKVTSDACENNKGRGRIAELVANLFCDANIKHVLTTEVHSSLVKSFYENIYDSDKALQEVPSNPFVAHYISKYSILDKSNNGKNLVLVSPDGGAKSKVNDILDILQNDYNLKNTSAIYLNKFRRYVNNPDALEISLNKEEPFSKNFTTADNKNLIIYDDLGDTMGTISTAAKQIKNDGLNFSGKKIIPKSVSGIIVHPVFSGKNYEIAMKKVATANFKEFVTFNTHPFIEDNLIYPLKKNTSIIRTAWLFGQAIYELENGHDVSLMYKTNGTYDVDMIDKMFYRPKRSSSFGKK